MEDDLNTQPGGDVLVESPDWLTQETLDGLTNKSISLDTLEPKQRQEFSAFLQAQATGTAKKVEAGTPAVPAEKPAAVAEPKPGEKPAATPAQAKPAKAKPDPWKDRERMLAETNRNKQLIENIAAGQRKLEEKLTSLAKNPPAAVNNDDPLDPESVRGLHAQLAETRDLLNALVEQNKVTSKALETEVTHRTQDLEKDATMLGLEKFQLETTDPDQFPPALSLKTTVPILELNNELQTFAAEVGGLANVNKYLSDPAYKAEIDGRGQGLSEAFLANLDKFNEVWAINQDVVEGKYPNHEVAYLDRLRKSGRLKEWQRDAKLEGANAVAAQVSGKNQQTPLLKPNQGPPAQAAGWTVQSALSWLRTHQDIKPGSAEATTKAEISALIQSGQLK